MVPVPAWSSRPAALRAGRLREPALALLASILGNAFAGAIFGVVTAAVNRGVERGSRLRFIQDDPESAKSA